MPWVGANARAAVAGEGAKPSRTNDFTSEPQRWRRDVPFFARVKVERVYRGIDLLDYGSREQLEYNFNVAPGADFKAIRLRFDGARRLTLDQAGDLALETAAGQIRSHPKLLQFGSAPDAFVVKLNPHGTA